LRDIVQKIVNLLLLKEELFISDLNGIVIGCYQTEADSHDDG